MAEIVGREVLLKDENGEVIVPYVGFASQGRNIGDIFYTSRLDTELNGAFECNGGTYSTGDFSGNQSIGNLLSGGKVPYVSLTEYESIVSTNGSCRAFGWDGGTSFRVPTLKDVYIEAGTASSAGEFISESLPNITGTFYSSNYKQMHDGSSPYEPSSGAFTNTNQGGTGGANWGANGGVFTLDASLSSSTYQDGAKVKPDSVRYRAMVQLAISTTDDAVITATSALQQISNKAEADLSNVSTISSNTSSLISSLGMPSSKYVDLTLGASGSTYIAPASGYYCVIKKSTGASQYVSSSTGAGLTLGIVSHVSNQGIEMYIPIMKGDFVQINYNAGGSTDKFRFIYAEGES